MGLLPAEAESHSPLVHSNRKLGFTHSFDNWKGSLRPSANYLLISKGSFTLQVFPVSEIIIVNKCGMF